MADNNNETMLAVGTRVHYRGDVCNVPGFGVIAAIRPASRWEGETYDIAMDDGDEMLGIAPSNFGFADGARFCTEAEYNEDRQRRIDGAEA